MVTKNSGTSKLKKEVHISQEPFSQLDAVHLDALGELIDVQLFSRFVFEHEAKRLAKKHGENDPKARRIKNAFTLNENLFQDLEVELKNAKTKASKVEKKGTGPSARRQKDA